MSHKKEQGADRLFVREGREKITGDNLATDMMRAVTTKVNTNSLEQLRATNSNNFIGLDSKISGEIVEILNGYLEKIKTGGAKNTTLVYDGFIGNLESTASQKESNWEDFDDFGYDVPIAKFILTKLPEKL